MDIDLFNKFFKSNNLAQGSILYILTNLLTKAIPFLLLPILTHYLSVEDFGVLSIVMALQGILINVFNFSMPSLLNLSYVRDSETITKPLITTSFLMSFCIFVLSTFVFYILSLFKVAIFQISFEKLILLLSHSLFCTFGELFFSILKAKRLPLTFGFAEITRALINVLFSILFVTYFNLGWAGRLYGMLLSSLFIFSVSLTYLRRNSLFGVPTKSSFHKIAIFGLPLVPHSLSNWLIASSDRLMISSMIDINANAIYTLSYQVASIIFIIGLSINYAWQPFLYELLKSKNLNKSFKYYFILASIIFFVSACLHIVTPYILPIIAPSAYSSSQGYVGILILSNFIMCLEMFLISYIFYFNKNKYLIFTTSCAAIINITINFILLPRIGVVGAAFSTLISYLFSFILNIILVYKILRT